MSECKDPVLLENSHASGRNALKRVCTGCAATDKSLHRSCKTKAKGDDETPAEQEMRANRFRDWAATERLVTGCAPEELPVRWKRELEKPTSETKTVNGEVLLRYWAGVEDRLGTKHSITAGLKQRCDLHSSEDLTAFGSQAEMRLQRGETLLRSDRMAADVRGVEKETQLLQIQQDMEATARQRMLVEQQLFEEAEKIEERKKLLASTKPKISSAAYLEKLQFENCIGRAKASCDATLP